VELPSSKEFSMHSTLKSWPDQILAEYNLYPQLSKTDWVHSSININKLFTSLYATFSIYPQLSKEELKWLKNFTERFKEFLVDYTLACCLGELRHAWKHSTAPSWDSSKRLTLLPKEILHLFTILNSGNFLGDQTSRTNRARELWRYYKNRGDTIPKICSQLEAFFNIFQWDSSFGGNAWGFIASLVRDLYKARSFPSIVHNIDALAHAAHKNAPFFTSSKFNWAQAYDLITFMEFKKQAQPCCFYHYMDKNKYYVLPVSVFEKLGKTPRPAMHPCCVNITYIIPNTAARSQEQLDYIEDHAKIAIEFRNKLQRSNY